jgi:quercetin dioxygenase-like cupin family protein
MQAKVSRWSDLPVDAPMALLERRRVIGEKSMVSHITLKKGFFLQSHSHENEQVSCVLSGKLKFGLKGGDAVIGPGEVILLPSNLPHSAEALEDTVVLDIFSPPSAGTGIDQKRPH